MPTQEALDNIKIWCPGGSEAAVEQERQETLDEFFLEGMGLRLSTTKSELMLYRLARQGVRGLVPLSRFPWMFTRGTARRCPG
ncbi:hypothetical protein HPB52_025600 [Rhipicephalus sanguineus]|uniref:Tick transposon n=1 Tax=Rhipicephalus sanguineus TaxID=34632 RepID=A0A9D4PA38_RHISA|nr:hypothetical protein HPB52_025600 [Rhipicephalus sanguineus]